MGKCRSFPGRDRRARSGPMAIGIAIPGFMLLDTSLHPVAFSPEMLRILAYPTKPDRVKQPSLFVFDKVRSSLVNQQGGHDLDFVKLYKSGNRRYTCPIVSPRMQREWETALLDWDLA